MEMMSHVTSPHRYYPHSPVTLTSVPISQELDEEKGIVTEKLHRLERQYDQTLNEFERARDNFGMRNEQNKTEIAGLQVR